jgi:Ras-related GTP-binding protein A/B
VHSIIPNAAVLSRHLTTFAQACSATEAILFERTTFLVIATSSPPDEGRPDQVKNDLSPTRYERTSELIKALKHSCSRMREEFHALEMELPEFTAVLDGMTRNTYILLIVHDPTIGMCASSIEHRNPRRFTLTSKSAETAALRINIRLARPKFEELQTDSVLA